MALQQDKDGTTLEHPLALLSQRLQAATKQQVGQEQEALVQVEQQAQAQQDRSA